MIGDPDDGAGKAPAVVASPLPGGDPDPLLPALPGLPGLPDLPDLPPAAEPIPSRPPGVALAPAVDLDLEELYELDLDEADGPARPMAHAAPRPLEPNQAPAPWPAGLPPPLPTSTAAEVGPASEPPLAPAALAPPPPSSAEVLESFVGEPARARIEIYQRELGLESEPARQAVLEHEIAWLVERELHDEAKAAAGYQRALAADPALKPSLWALRRQAEHEDDWPRLLALIEAEAAAAPGPRERAELLVEKGQLLEDRLRDPQGALAAYQAAAAEDAGSLPALMALERRALRAGDAAGHARLLPMLVAATAEPPRKAELLVELARSEDERSPPGAAPFERLREALALRSGQGRVLDEMERMAIARRQPAVLLEALEARAALLSEDRAAGGAADLERLVELRRRQAALCREDDPERARGYLAAGLALSPEEPLLLLELAEVDAAAGRPAQAAELLGRLGTLLSPPAATRVGFAQARSLRAAGRSEEAAALEGALARDPRTQALLCAEAQDRAAKVGDAHGLAAGLREEARLAQAAGEPSWSARALAACGAMLERAGDPEGAIAAWRQALEHDPDDLVALSALDRALGRRGLVAPRAEVLERRLASAAPREAARLLEELIELRSGPLGDVDGALQAALRLRQLGAEGPPGADVGPLARVVEIARAAGRYDLAAGYLEQLGQSLARQGAAEEAVVAELERASLIEERGAAAASPPAAAAGGAEPSVEARGAALAALESALRLSPGHPVASERRLRLLRELARFRELSDSLVEVARRESDPGRATRLLVEAALLQRDQLADPAGSAAAWRALAERTSDENLARRALGLALRQSGSPRQLANYLTWAPAAAGAASPPIAEPGRQLLLGELLDDELGDQAAAAAAFAAALAGGDPLAPHAALGGLRVALRQAAEPGGGNHSAVERALADLLPLSDGPTGAALLEEQASLALARGELDVAEARLRSALELDPLDLGARLGLARLAARRGPPERLAAALSGLSDAIAPGPLSSALRLRSLVLAAAAGRVEPAAARAVLRPRPGEPDHAGSAAVVASVVASEPEALALRASGPSGDPARDVELAVERVEALLLRGQLGEAHGLLQAQLARAPGDVVLLELLVRLADAGGDRLGEARARHLLGRALRDPAAAAAELDRAARALESLGQRLEAAQAWRALCAVQPAIDEPFQRAAALLRELDDPGALEQLLTDWIARTGDAAERGALLVDRGLLRASTARPRLAAVDLEAALELGPEQPRALEALSTLRAEAGDRSSAAALLERRLALGTGGEGERDLLRRLLDLYQYLGDLDGVQRTLRRLVPLEPDSPTLRQRAADLLERLGDPIGALEHLARRATLGDAGGRAEAELRAGLIHQGALGDRGQARAALLRALAIDPLLLDALAALLPLCTSPEELAERDGALRRALRAASEAVDAEPAEPRNYHTLERLLDWIADEDGRQLAAQAAAAVAAQPVAPRRPEPDPTGELPIDLFERVFPLEARGAALAVWREAHEAGQRLLGPDPAALGLGRATRQADRAGWSSVDRIARALGVGPFQLHTLAGPGALDGLWVVGDALALGSAYRGQLGARERFLVSRQLVLLRDRLGPLERAKEEPLQLFFAACARVADTRWSGAEGLPEPRVDEWARQVSRLLDRRARRALQAMAPRFAELPSVGLWRRELVAGANRIALAVSGDLSAALAGLGPDAGASEQRALARFAVSEQMAALRRALGLRS